MLADALVLKENVDNSVIVALKLQDEDVIRRLSDVQDTLPGEKSEEFHITLVYLGEKGNIDDKLVSALLDSLMLLGEVPIIEGVLNGVAAFRTPDGIAIVYTYDSPSLTDFQAKLLQGIHDYLPVPQGHGFIPHVTLTYAPEGTELPPPPDDIELTFDDVWLFIGEERFQVPFRRFKQFPIGEGDKQRLIDLRIQLFFDESDALAEQLFVGEISIGQWEEQMRQSIRQVHASCAAIGKGGWDEMTPADWGRLGPVVKEQYRYLHNFAQHISENRDTVSLKYIQARARLYGDGAGKSAVLMQSGIPIEKFLPWLPKDGSTECLNRCKCRWELDVVRTIDEWKYVRAVWRLGVAEHCPDCVGREGHVETFRVHQTVEVPSVIGGL